jgi:hypothetical protein
MQYNLEISRGINEFVINARDKSLEEDGITS